MAESLSGLRPSTFCNSTLSPRIEKRKKKKKSKTKKETKFSSEVHFRKGYVWHLKNYGKDDMTHFTGYVAELKEDFPRITEACST